MSLADKHPFYLANDTHSHNTDLEVRDKPIDTVRTLLPRPGNQSQGVDGMIPAPRSERS